MTPDTDTMKRDILAVAQGYGYGEQTASTRRQQRALRLVLGQHYRITALTRDANGLPVLVELRVRSERGSAEYDLTRLPNQMEYTCTCADSHRPCKHLYGALLLQEGIRLAHTYRLTLHTYHSTVRALQFQDCFRWYEIAALQALLNTGIRYHDFAVAAAKSVYGPIVDYASRMFSALVTRARERYGIPFRAAAVDHVGTLYSGLDSVPDIPIRWHPVELRWYVSDADGAEDIAATRDLLTLPPEPLTDTEASDTPSHRFEDEEPEGHYALPTARTDTP